jgi:hypothetical protein
MRSGAPTQERPGAGGIDGGQVRGLGAWRRVTDPVDARMHSQQAARSQPRRDLSIADAGTKQLGTCHHPVPRSGDLTQHLFDCPACRTDLVG